jgi:hypothetical protein
MRIILTIPLVITAIILSGCTFSSGKVHVKVLSQIEKGDKKVTFLNNTPYIADMSIALSEQGFDVLPMPTQEQIIEIRNTKQISKFNKATTRWGITITTKDSPLECVFSDFSVRHFTLMLTDITNNRVVMVLKQKGADGPCPPLVPVFGTLSEKLSKKW